jgi:hypothetical protein
MPSHIRVFDWAFSQLLPRNAEANLGRDLERLMLSEKSGIGDLS